MAVTTMTIKRYIKRKKPNPFILGLLLSFLGTLLVIYFHCQWQNTVYYNNSPLISRIQSLVNLSQFRKHSSVITSLKRVTLPERTEVIDLQELESARPAEFGQGCEVIRYEPFDEEISAFDHYVPRLVCYGLDWVKCHGSKCRIIPEIHETTEDIKCVYREILYVKDSKYKLGPPVVVIENQSYELWNSDHVRVQCVGNHVYGQFETMWSGRAVGFRKVDLVALPEHEAGAASVLVVGLGSMSKNAFIRRMAKSYEMMEKLHFTMFNGFTTFGDETIDTIFPLLSGRKPHEVPFNLEGRTNQTLDQSLLLFHKLSEDGYRTAYFEDSPYSSTFSRFNGFDAQPAQHYLKPFLIDAFGRSKRSHNNKCVGDSALYEIVLKVTYQFFEQDGKKLCFSFLNSQSGDTYDYISSADGTLENFLRRFNQSGLMDTTLVILMGDHGINNPDILLSNQGNAELRLPLLAIHLPKKLRRFDAILKKNVEALTTSLDVYETILEAVSLVEHKNYAVVNGSKFKRGISLFRHIPKKRSCGDADIDPRWCSCPDWEDLYLHDMLYSALINSFVDYINSFTKQVRHICEVLAISSVIYVKRLMPHGVRHRLNSNLEHYKFKLVLYPSNACYETISMYRPSMGKFYFTPEAIHMTQVPPRKTHCADNNTSFNSKYVYKFCHCITTDNKE